MPSLELTCLFDRNIDNGGGVQFKEEGLVEIIDDYNKNMTKSFLLEHMQDSKRYCTKIGS